MRSTQRLLAGLLLLAAAATRLFAAQAEISGIDKIYVRAGPGSEEPAIGVLSAGDPVDILDIEGSWTKIQTSDGKVGYVYHRYVTPRVGAEGAAAAGTTAAGTAVPPPTVKPATQPASPRPAPAPAAAAPAPVAEKAEDAEVTAELATLRAEIADLKEKIQHRRSELATEGERQPLPLPDASPYGSFAGSNDPAVTPSAAAPLSARDQAVGVLMIALFSLVIGWVLGSTFGRRGPRSRSGGRLRF